MAKPFGDTTTIPQAYSDLTGTVPSNVLPGGTPTGSGPIVMATSPVLTTPTLVGSPATGDNSLAVATTAFVKAQNYITSAGAPVTTVFTRSGAVVATSGDYAVAQITGAASLASPTFTGVPAAPTAAANTNTTQLATTAFVVGQNYAQRIVAVDLITQAATITGATLLAAGSVQTGMYRLTGWTKVTRAATTSSTSGPLTITFTEGTDSTSLTPTISWMTSAGAVATTNATNSITVTGSNTFNDFVFFAKSGVAITYTFTYASSGATTMQFDLHMRLEFLG
jgi:hypothetical protein